MDMETEKINSIMCSFGMPIWGISAFDDIRAELIRCGSARRLPENAASVITAVFPYYSGCDDDGEISRYAAVPDYHIVAGNMLKSAAASMHEHFPEYRFEPFCDASPIPEVKAARLAGLGVVGQNGLLITPRFGSYVFIGEIITDLILPPCENPGGGCFLCGKCTAQCPALAIGADGVERKKCISDITQRKGELCEEQKQLIKKAGTIWGCDICQKVCPMNRNVEKTFIEKFSSNIICKLTKNEIEDENFEKKFADRSFMWRGKQVLIRNIGILHSAPDNNIKVKSKK